MAMKVRGTEKRVCNCHSYNADTAGQPNVILTVPAAIRAHTDDRETVCIDACIALVISALWEYGLPTLNSCCGHNKRPASIVIPGDFPVDVYVETLKRLDPERIWIVSRWESARVGYSTHDHLLPKALNYYGFDPESVFQALTGEEMMAISKEQWHGIQNTLTEAFSCVEFKLPTGEAVTVNKTFISENKTGLIVWIDGVRSEAWGWPPHDEFRPIVKQVWRRKTYQPGAKQVRKISAMKGGKAFLKRKENADLFRVYEYWVCYFSTAASLVRQFRKIEGLELVVEEVVA